MEREREKDTSFDICHCWFSEMCLENPEKTRICDASRGGNEKTREKNCERESTQSLLSGPQCEPFMCGIWTSLIMNPAALLGVKVHDRSISNRTQSAILTFPAGADEESGDSEPYAGKLQSLE